MTRTFAHASAQQELRRKTASLWLTRHESGVELSTAELQAWEAWITDPSNSTEYDAFVRMRWQLKGMPRPSLPSVADLMTPAPVLPYSDGSVIHTAAAKTGLAARHPALKLSFAAAAACLAAIVVVVYRVIAPPYPFELDPDHRYSTQAAEEHRFTLADGSTVTLSGGTSLTVTLSRTQRTAVLDRGEARFQVRHERWRPFTVYAGPGSITAVGTVFDVRRYSNRVYVTVSEGAVEVAPQAAPMNTSSESAANHAEPGKWIPLRVAHGEEMTYGLQGEATAPRQVDAHVASAWARGLFVYRDRPLHEVIEDVQRYSARRIVLDASTGDLLYRGTFAQHDVEQWLASLPKIFPVEVVNSRSDVVIIRSKVGPQLDANAGNGR